MTPPIRIGIVGAGFAARFHALNLLRVHTIPAQLSGVTSRSPETREKFSREFSVPAFHSFQALCDASDVIDLCSPPSTHEQLAIEALRRGKHIIVEKPFTGYFGPGEDSFQGNTSPKDPMLQHAVASCNRIIEAARAAGKTVCYAENWIYAPAVQKGAEIVTRSGAQILWLPGN